MCCSSLVVRFETRNTFSSCLEYRARATYLQTGWDWFQSRLLFYLLLFAYFCIPTLVLYMFLYSISFLFQNRHRLQAEGNRKGTDPTSSRRCSVLATCDWFIRGKEERCKEDVSHSGLYPTTVPTSREEPKLGTALYCRYRYWTLWSTPDSIPTSSIIRHAMYR